MNWIDRFLSLQFTWRDLLDVLIVAVIVYYILALIRGTRAMQISIGLMFLASTYFVARILNLQTLEVVSKQILFYLPFAIIVLFQQEIRRGLARIGENPLLHLFRKRPILNLDSIIDACMILSEKKIGALIAIEGDQTLRGYEEGARPIDAVVSSELIINIFWPGAPLHDGAILIRGNRITSAGAFLPLTSASVRELAHGTRHRAALGLSEETDALVLVVSEENGSIAIARAGVMQEQLDRQSLRIQLLNSFGEIA